MKNKKQKAKIETKRIKKFGVANWLTVLRMALMIPFIILMSIAFLLVSKNGGTFWYNGIKLVGNQQYPITLSTIYWLNIIIFIFAMITDFVDGYIARKTKTISQFGKIFDPIADKITTTLMLIFLSLMNYSFLPIVILFIIRDILVDGARVYAVKKDIKVAANWWGKIKTIIVSLAILVVSFSAPWITKYIEKTKSYGTNETYLLYVNIPLIVGLVLSWISGIIYLSKYLKGISKQYQEDIKNQKEEKDNKTITKEEIIIEDKEQEKNKNSKNITYEEPFF
ncbi:CDP-diacylglycerol--glycerol-3-phosphate 3-phosphatidyltransferase [Metamycoplasma gateae]|uniref:CDP-diacylglycerol--glycerol-3-phosphate 3-phosphatidyltransferase n=1 Tax=Metamycoplasma gateae TaxID=35769 RepID=A0ABZ2AL99_9BACT|nr:CDP-diacylglycerol--glycerol-3-phosphate 3-phosphatidyltransferase [Metamycoplasma gateae]